MSGAVRGYRPPGPRYQTREEVDFVIVGSGAAGGVLAAQLSEAGHSVVVFEQGPYNRPGDFSGTTGPSWSRTAASRSCASWPMPRR